MLPEVVSDLVVDVLELDRLVTDCELCETDDVVVLDVAVWTDDVLPVVEEEPVDVVLPVLDDVVLVDVVAWEVLSTKLPW